MINYKKLERLMNVTWKTKMETEDLADGNDREAGGKVCSRGLKKQ